MSKVVWQPSAEQIEAARVTAFRRFVEQRWHLALPDYRALYHWSIENPGQFWQAVWWFCGIVSSREWDQVVVDFDRMPGARWFVGSRLNFAENLLRYRDAQEALVFWNETGRVSSLTYSELYSQTARVAAALRARGIAPGDRVAGYLPNLPEAVVAMLATTSLGAVWSSCSPDFGVSGVLDRFGQIQPKVLFAADGYLYAGKQFDLSDRIAEIVRQLPSLESVVLVPYLSDFDLKSQISNFKFQISNLKSQTSNLKSEVPISRSEATRSAPSATPNVVAWADLLASSLASKIDFAQLPFDHPLYILYSSGTTGPPKCIVHGAGGTLLQHQKEHVLHTDLRREDRIFYFTTLGWMMWNWLVSSLAVGAKVLLYDGSPLAPRPEMLFDLAQNERITVFGASPRFLTAVEKAGLQPRRTHDLSSLRTILSTGSPLSGESFDYVVSQIKPEVQLASISGGTDICSCFALGNPVALVYRGELQTRGLGMEVQVFDETGRALVGQKGELVCTAPFPAMPLGFWKDPGDANYQQAYFARYPGVWWHGDYAELTEQEGMIIYGRSDAVLNPGGVRIGTAELYRQVEQLPEVLESVVVGQDWQGDVRVILFVKLRPEVSLGDELTARIKEQIRRNTTPRHVPAKIVQVHDIPRTRSGKIVELAIRDVLHGRPLKNLEALANPEALDNFRNLPELAT